MKLSVFDRILLFLSMLFMLVIGVGIAMVCTSAITFSEMARYAEVYFYGTNGLLILVAIAAVIILVAVKLILSLFTSPKEKSEAPKDSGQKIILKNSEDGNIMVSADLVKDIAVRFAKSSDDVRDVDCKILNEENGVKILMKFFLKRDIPIREFLSTKQIELRDYVEKYSGINVLSTDLCADVNNSNNSSVNNSSRVR